MVALLAGACGPDVYEYKNLDEACAAKCDHALTCQGEATPGALQKCTDGCAEDGDDALSVGADCARAYERLLSCLEPLSCEVFLQWAYMTEPRPCQSETDSFSTLCPDVWFAPGPS